MNLELNLGNVEARFCTVHFPSLPNSVSHGKVQIDSSLRGSMLFFNTTDRGRTHSLS